MDIEKCRRCLEDPICKNQVVEKCLPVPFFGDIAKPHLKVVTIGLNPALNEFQTQATINPKSQRLAMLVDYGMISRVELRVADIHEAKARREKYFKNPERQWHSYFEKMESVLTRVHPAWTYCMGSAAHLDLVACATKDRWSYLANGCQTALIGHCRKNFLHTLADLPSNTVLLCDGNRVNEEMQQLGLRLELENAADITNENLPQNPPATFWVGKLFYGDKTFPLRGWSLQVSKMSAVWRADLARWIHSTVFPKSAWPTLHALKPAAAATSR